MDAAQETDDHRTVAEQGHRGQHAPARLRQELQRCAQHEGDQTGQTQAPDQGVRPRSGGRRDRVGAVHLCKLRVLAWHA